MEQKRAGKKKIQFWVYQNKGIWADKRAHGRGNMEKISGNLFFQ